MYIWEEAAKSNTSKSNIFEQTEFVQDSTSILLAFQLNHKFSLLSIYTMYMYLWYNHTCNISILYMFMLVDPFYLICRNSCSSEERTTAVGGTSLSAATPASPSPIIEIWVFIWCTRAQYGPSALCIASSQGSAGGLDVSACGANKWDWASGSWRQERRRRRWRLVILSFIDWATRGFVWSNCYSAFGSLHLHHAVKDVP